MKKKEVRKVLENTKLYREVAWDGVVYLGSDDVGGDTDYLIDFFSEHCLKNKRILDLGSAGGAVCFTAIRSGVSFATGVELDERRIKGARKLKKILGVKNVEFIKKDFYNYLYKLNKIFDITFVLNILHHIRNPYPLLQKVCRVTREYIIIETPKKWSVDKYGREYCSKLSLVEGAREVQSIEDIINYLKVFSFYLIFEKQSDTSKKFFGVDKRFVYVFKYKHERKDEDARSKEMEIYRSEREKIDVFVRQNPRKINAKDMSKLIKDYYGYNFIIIGGRASGKSYLCNFLANENIYESEMKLFKLHRNTIRFWRYLFSFDKRIGKFATVMLSTEDDSRAHCNIETLIYYIKNKKIICLVLYPSYNILLKRLCKREKDRINRVDSDVNFDYSIRFDCRKYIEEFEKNNIKYFFVTFNDKI